MISVAGSASRYSGRARIAALSPSCAGSTKWRAGRREARGSAHRSASRRSSSPVCAQRQHLLHPAAPDLRGDQHDPPDPAIDRDAVPRLADADAVDLARRQRIGGERRAGTVTISTSASGRMPQAAQPVAQHVVVARIAVDHAETQRLARRLARRPTSREAAAQLCADRPAAAEPDRLRPARADSVTALPLSPSTNGTASGVAPAGPRPSVVAIASGAIRCAASVWP